MYKLIIRNKKDSNWEFNDDYVEFDDVINRISKILKIWKDEIPKTSIYNLSPFEIKIYDIENEKEND